MSDGSTQTGNIGASAPAASAASATPAQAPASAPASSSVSSSPMSAEEVLRFDPFGSDNGDSSAPASGPGGDGGGQEPAQAAPASQPPKATPVTPAADDPEKALLKQQLEELRRAAAAPAQVPQSVPQTEVDPLEQVPGYDFTLNDDLVGAITSGDPQLVRQSLAAVSKGVAQAVHRTLMQQVVGVFGPRMQQMMMQSLQTQQQQQQMRHDFYSTYPQFNRPELWPVVVATGEKLAAELGVGQYSPQFRDALGKRLMAMFGAGMVQQQQQVAPQVTPPVMMGGGTRQNGLSQEDKLAASIRDMFI